MLVYLSYCISCTLQSISYEPTGNRYLVENTTGVTHIHHYLDDFFVSGTADSEQCSQHLHTFVSLCVVLGVPLADDKREGPITCLEYLIILLDSASLEARLPP